ncbi:MAG TPA: hypothetical protein VGC21_06425 [Telluria sp.]
MISAPPQPRRARHFPVPDAPLRRRSRARRRACSDRNRLYIERFGSVNSRLKVRRCGACAMHDCALRRQCAEKNMQTNQCIAHEVVMNRWFTQASLTVSARSFSRPALVHARAPRGAGASPVRAPAARRTLALR